MQRPPKLPNYKITKLHNSSGYVLLTLMLFFSLLAVAAVAVLPEIAAQIKRDREEEMIHRAVGYSRAIRKYYKKFGRYPTRIEELESSNNLRFLRKRYKDPVTGQDFKFLHLQDVAFKFPSFGRGIQAVPGQGGNQLPGQAGNPQLRQPPPGGAGLTQMPGGGPTGVQQPPPPAESQAPPPGGDGQAPAADSEQADKKSQGSDSAPGGQVFGGGPIVGVASISKKRTIREFNRQNHYNDWFFIYDPGSDRGGLLNTPFQPDLNKGGFGGQQQGEQGNPGGQPGPGPAPAPDQGSGGQDSPD